MISSITYNGYTFDQDVATIRGFQGAGFPIIDASEEVKSQQDGSFATGFRYRSRIIGWNGILGGQAATPASYESERNSLAAALNPSLLEGHEMSITLVSGNIRTVRAARIMQGVSMDFPVGEPSRTWNSYQVLFVCSFPFFEGTETTETQLVTTIVGGAPIPTPVAMPMATAATSSTDPNSMTNSGNANAYPVFTITGPGTDFTITNSTTGHSFTISTTLGVGETITVDVWNQSVTIGGDSIRDVWDGDWIYLQPGDNVLTFSVTSGSDGNTQLKTVYKDTYLTL